MSKTAEYVVLEEDVENGHVSTDEINEQIPPEPKKPSKWSVWTDMILTELNLPKISSMQDLKVSAK